MFTRHFLAVVVIALTGSTLLSASPAAARDCVRLSRDGGGEALLNRCGDCREVSIERSRAGSGFPLAQTVTVPQRSEHPLGFRGPGRTRITAERACSASPAPPATPSDEAAVACIQAGETPVGTTVLANPCPVCRAARVEHIDASGNRKHRSYSVAPQSILELPLNRGTRDRIITETSCG